MVWWKRRTPQRDVALDDLALAVLIQEHTAVRDEILASYGYAQSIVRWSLATFAAVLAAGLLLLGDKSGAQVSPVAISIALLIFGFAVPGLVWLNSWSWLGELYRAERAGSYLRALEKDLASVSGLVARLGFQPARWESFISANRAAKGLWGKQTVTYLGTAGVFFGSATASEVVFYLVVVESAHLSTWAQAVPAWLWLVSSLAVHVTGIVVAFSIFRRLMRLGSGQAPVQRTYR